MPIPAASPTTARRERQDHPKTGVGPAAGTFPDVARHAISID
jgi:hypothetical protein